MSVERLTQGISTSIAVRGAEGGGIEKLFPVYLGNELGTERIVIREKLPGKQPEFIVEKYNKAEKQWVEEFSAQLPGWGSIRVLPGYWEDLGRNVAVVYCAEKNGSLTYIVTGRRRGRITTFLKRSGVRNGAVFFSGGNLIEAEGNTYYSWVASRRGFTAVRHGRPQIPSATTIKYGITGRGIVEAEKKEYRVAPGTVVQLERTDRNEAVEKIMFAPSPVLRFFQQPYAFRITGRGKVEFLILPDGGGEENGARFTVLAE